MRGGSRDVAAPKERAVLVGIDTGNTRHDGAAIGAEESLRELDLELAFEAPRPRGEDVEDQLAPVEDLRVEPLGERALLAGAEILVDENDRRPVLLRGRLELLDLSLPDVGRRADLADVLVQGRDRLDASSARQSLELAQRFLGADRGAVVACVSGVDADEDGALLRRRHVPRPSPHGLHPGIRRCRSESLRASHRPKHAALRTHGEKSEAFATRAQRSRSSRSASSASDRTRSQSKSP